MRVEYEELELGGAPDPLTLGPISRTNIVQYQGASGDMNPIHHDEPFAHSAGFEVPLGVGMYPAGVMHAWLASWLGPERIRSCRTRWRSAYFPGDTLHFTGEITSISDPDGGRRVEVAANCVNQDGVVTMQGWASFEF